MNRPPLDDRLRAAKAALSAANDRLDSAPAAPAPFAPPARPDVYYAAVPFIRGAEGELVAGNAVRQPSAGAAEGEARRMAQTADGALAFLRSGDFSRGTYDEMVVIRTFGEVPPLGRDAEAAK